MSKWAAITVWTRAACAAALAAVVLLAILPWGRQVLAWRDAGQRIKELRRRLGDAQTVGNDGDQAPRPLHDDDDSPAPPVQDDTPRPRPFAELSSAPWLLELRQSGPGTSWSSVGGCGVSGGGGGGGARWIGRRAPGGRVEAELTESYSQGEDLRSLTSTLKLATQWDQARLRFDLALPIVENQMEFEQFGLPARRAILEPGDASLTVSRQFGLTGSWSLSGTVGLPTGPHDLGADEGEPFHIDIQPGRGEVTTSVAVEHSADRGMDQIHVSGLSYAYNGGENDIGNYRADTVGGYYYIGWRREMSVHSVGVQLSHALDDDRDGVRGTIETPDLLMTFQYGYERFLPFDVYRRWPVLIAPTVTMDESLEINAWALSLGITTSF